jgi:AcrR family transcriptional regulator
MGRVEGPSERDRLLGLVVDLILREGVIDLSLSALARKIGSNNRMILYYFGSKQELLDEASTRAFEQFPLLNALFARLSGPGDLEERLVHAWRDLSDPANHDYLRLYFQRFGIAMRETGQWDVFLERQGSTWPDMVAGILRTEGYDAATSKVVGLEVVALWRGLQLLLLSGADPDELDASYRFAVRGMIARSDAAPSARARG